MACKIFINNEESALYNRAVSEFKEEGVALLSYTNALNVKALKNSQGEPDVKTLTSNPYEKEYFSYLANLLDSYGFEYKLSKDLGDIKGVANIFKGLAEATDLNSLTEESMHLMVSLLPRNNTLFNRMYNSITDYKEYNEVKEAYSGVYTTEEEFRLEAIGKVLTNKLMGNLSANVIKQTQSDSWLNRLWAWFKSVTIGGEFDLFLQMLNTNPKVLMEPAKILKESKAVKIEDGKVYVNGIYAGYVENTGNNNYYFDVLPKYQQAVAIHIFAKNKEANISGLNQVALKTLANKGLIDFGVIARAKRGEYYALGEPIDELITKLFKTTSNYDVDKDSEKQLAQHYKPSLNGWQIGPSQELYTNKVDALNAIKEFLTEENVKISRFSDLIEGYILGDTALLSEKTKIKEGYFVKLKTGLGTATNFDTIEIAGHKILYTIENNHISIVVPNYRNLNISGTKPLVSKLKKGGILTFKEKKALEAINIADSNKGLTTLLAAIAAAKLRKDNPTMNFNIVRAASRSEVLDLNLYDGLKALKALVELGQISYDDLGLVEDDLVLNGYNKNPIYLLSSYYSTSGGVGGFSSVTSDDDLLKWKSSDLKNALDARLGEITRKYQVSQIDKPSQVIITDSAVAAEYKLLLQVYNEYYSREKGYNINTIKTEFMTTFGQYLKGSLDYNIAELSQAFYIIRKYLRMVKSEFVNIYSVKRDKIFSEYLDNKQSVAGMALNTHESYYQHLFEDKIQLPLFDKDGNQKFDANGQPIYRAVNTAILKDPATLSGEDKIFAEKLIGLMKEVVIDFIQHKFDTGQLDPSNYDAAGKTAAEVWYDNVYKQYERMLPPIHGSVLSKLNIKEFKGAANMWVQSNIDLEKYSHYEHMRELKEGDGFGILTTVLGATSNLGTDARIKSLGLEEVNGQLVLVDEARNQSLSYDLQFIADNFILNIKKQKYNREFSNAYFVSSSLLHLRALGTSSNLEKESYTLYRIYNMLVNREMEEVSVSILDRKYSVNKFLQVAGSVADATTLAFNYKGALIANLDDFVTTITTFAFEGWDTQFFPSLKDFLSAQWWMKSNLNTALDIAKYMGVGNMNQHDLLYSDRLKSKKSGALRGALAGRYNVAAYGAMSFYGKVITLIAKLHKDGILNNFERDAEGNIYYNWSKDKRVTTQPEVFNKIVQNLEGSPKINGQYIMPYDNIIMDSLSAMTASMYGNMDEETVGYLQTRVVATGYLKYKSFLLAKANRLYKEGIENESIAYYSKSGEVVLLYQEGIINSLMEISKDVAGMVQAGTIYNAWKDYPSIRKANVKITVFSFMAFAILRMLFGEVKDKYAQYALQDLISMYNPNEYIRALTSPVFTKPLAELSEILVELISLDLDQAARQTIDLMPFKTVTDKILEDVTGTGLKQHFSQEFDINAYFGLVDDRN